NSNVYALAVSGSNLYAGGYFTTAGASPAKYIAKWDGSNWTPLGSGMQGGNAQFPGSVLALAVVGSDLYAGGSFTNAGGILASNIAKWNGSSWSALGLGLNTVVNALAGSGNSLYAGGSFVTAGGSPASFIARWDGNSWTPLGSGLNRRVLALALST